MCFRLKSFIFWRRFKKFQGLSFQQAILSTFASMEPKECFGPWCLIHTMEFEPYHAIFKPSILRLASRATPTINFENLARQGHMDVDSPSITNGIVDHTIHRWLKALIHIQGCNKPRRHESTLHCIWYLKSLTI